MPVNFRRVSMRVKPYESCWLIAKPSSTQQLKSCVTQALQAIKGTCWSDWDVKFYCIVIGVLKYSGLYESLIESCLHFMTEVQGAFYAPGAIPSSVEKALDDILGETEYRTYEEEDDKIEFMLGSLGIVHTDVYL